MRRAAVSRSAYPSVAVICAATLLLLWPHGGAAAQAVGIQSRTTTDTLLVYGPGGPLPAMRDAAAQFERETGTHIALTGGPTAPWLAKARGDADVIFSGAENMMTDYIRQLADTDGGVSPPPGRIDESTIEPLYLRPAAMLVRKGNPRHIRRFEDLLRSGVKVLVVQGAGQNGLWEDIAGHRGSIEDLRSFRRNIAVFATNSGEAKAKWTSDPSLDVWLIWNIWQVANPTLADVVPLSRQWVIYRDAGVALTVKGRTRDSARRFATFLRSPAGARIFAKWGWMTEPIR